MIGGLQISPVGYAFMTKKLVEMNKKTMLVLEGGYTESSLIASANGVVNSIIGCLSVEENKDL